MPTILPPKFSVGHISLWLTHTLLPRTLYSLGTLCSPEHFTPQHVLLSGTLCPTTQFAAWNTLLLGTLYSLFFSAHFAKVCISLPISRIDQRYIFNNRLKVLFAQKYFFQSLLDYNIFLCIQFYSKF